jgi:hypothetical protein
MRFNEKISMSGVVEFKENRLLGKPWTRAL